MDAKVGDSFNIGIWVSDGNLGVTGSTVTLYLYDESGNLTVNGGSASEVGGGLYRYTNAATYDVAGVWLGYVVASGGSTTPSPSRFPFEIRVEGDYTAARAAYLDAAISSRSSHSAADAADAVWDEPLTGATHNVPTSAGRRLRSVGDAVGGTVDDAAATTTTFVTDLPADVDEFYDDQLVLFLDGDLAGQVRPILSYNGTTKQITLAEALTSAPGNGDAFDVLPYHVHPISQIAEGVATELSATVGQVATLATDYTTARAAKLDYLDMAISGVSAAVVAAFKAITTASITVAGTWMKYLQDNVGGGGGSTAEEVWSYEDRELTSLAGLITSDDSVISPVTGGSVTVYQGCDYSSTNGTQLEIPVTGDVTGHAITITIKGVLADEEDKTITDAEGGDEIVTLELTAAETAAMVATNTSRYPISRKLLITSTSGGLTKPIKEGVWIVKEGA